MAVDQVQIGKIVYYKQKTYTEEIDEHGTVKLIPVNIFEDYKGIVLSFDGENNVPATYDYGLFLCPVLLMLQSVDRNNKDYIRKFMVPTQEQIDKFGY